MFVTNWISPTKIQKISEITNFFRHYFLSRTEVYFYWRRRLVLFFHEAKSWVKRTEQLVGEENFEHS